MADTSDKTAKQVKREAKSIREDAQRALAAGDYKLANELNAKVVELLPDSETGRAAQRTRDNLKIDPHGMYAGLLAIAIFALAWIIFY